MQSFTWMQKIILGLLALVILGFNYWGIFVFEEFKFQVLIVGIWVLLLVLVFLNRKKCKKMVKLCIEWFQDLPVWSVEFLLISFVSVLAVSVLFNYSAAHTSIWGAGNRYMGILTWVHLLIWFFLVKRFFGDKFSWFKLSYFFNVVTLCVGLYAALQKIGLDLPGFYGTFTVPGTGIYNRVFSTLGHPNYLGMFIVLILPFFFYLFVNEKRRLYQIFNYFNFFLIYLTLMWTLNRGAWIGSIVVSVVYLIGVLLAKQKKNGWQIFKFVVVCLLMFSLFTPAWSFGFGERVREDRTLDRMGSLEIRFNEWKFASQKIWERPILGFGLENYRLISGERERSDLEFISDHRSSDRVHNIFLDILMNGGFLALLVYLFLMVKVVIVLWRSFANKELYFVSLTLLAGFVGYLVAIQVHFDTISSLVLLLLYLALTVVLPSKKIVA
jgi:O-antigen ligase